MEVILTQDKIFKWLASAADNYDLLEQRLKPVWSFYQLSLPPENTVYGQPDNMAFVRSVMKWARDSQKDVYKEDNPKISDFTRTGGEYFDSGVNDSTMFARFFDDPNYTGKAKYEAPEDSEESPERIADRWDEEIQEISGQYKFTNPIHGSAEASVGDNMAYISIYGSFALQYPSDSVIKSFPTDWQEKRKVEDKIRKVIHHVSYLNVSEIDFHDEEEIRVSVDYENDGHGDEGPEQFKSFMDDLESFDEQHYKKVKQAVWLELVNLGFYRPHFSQYVGKKYTQEDFKNFQYTINDDSQEPNFESHPIPIGIWDKIKLGNPPGLTYSGSMEHENEPEAMKEFAELLKAEVIRFSQRVKLVTQQYFQGFDSANRKPFNFAEHFGVHPDIRFKMDKDLVVYATLYFYFDSATHDELDLKKTTVYIKYLDKNFENIVKLSQRAWQQIEVKLAAHYHKSRHSAWITPKPDATSNAP